MKRKRRAVVASVIGLAGVAGALTLMHRSAPECEEKLELWFDPEPLLVGSYRIEVRFAGYSASCEVRVPGSELRCQGDPMWIGLQNDAIVRATVPGRPARVHTRVFRDGVLLRERTLYPGYRDEKRDELRDCTRHKALWTL